MWVPIKKLLISCCLGVSITVGLLTFLFTTEQTGRAADDVLCVVPAGSSTGPFSACDQVFTSIQDAVDAAAGGEEIWIATGVYTGVHTRNGLTQLVYLDKDVTIRGGYAVPFDVPPDPTASPTILDAERQGRGIYVVTGTNTTIIGLHITEGNATGQGGKSGSPIGWGGGVFAISATVGIRDSVIFSNTADTYYDPTFNVGAGFGGGLAFRHATVTLEANTIRDNLASLRGQGVGGGVAIEDSTFYLAQNWVLGNTAVLTRGENSFGGGIAVAQSSGQFIDNLIEENATSRRGGSAWAGAIYIERYNSTDDTTILIEGNTIQRNTAMIEPSEDTSSNHGEGGGLLIYNDESSNNAFDVTIANNLFLSNTASVTAEFGLGGGVFVVNRNSIESPIPFTFTNNALIGNTAVVSASEESGGGLGGGLVIGNVNAILEHNRFLSNTATISGSYGVAGGIYFYDGKVTQQGDIVQANKAHHSDRGLAGGIYFDGTQARLENVVAADNQAGGNGAGLWIISSDLDLAHATLARNSDSEAIYVEDPATGEWGTPSTVWITNTIIASHTTGIRVNQENMVSVNGVLWHDTPVAVSYMPSAQVTISNQRVGNPMFAADGNHITAGSAARFQGVPSTVVLDIDGEGRPPAKPSLGADEYWPYQQYLAFMSNP
ncbi:MAG TPA: hypothetical protein VF177_13795 [Anaerolineae bacterium]